MARILFFSLLSLASCSLSESEPAPFIAPNLADLHTGQAQIVDLSHTLDGDNPYWPGEAYSPFQFEILATIEKDGVFSGAFSSPEHLGTHLDAPNHFVSGQDSVDEISLQRLVAPIAVVDIREAVEKNPDYQLLAEDLEAWEEKYGRIPQETVVFAFTGWGQHWDEYSSYKNEDEEGVLHFPGFSPEAAAFLVEQRAVKGLGIDTLSVDPGLSEDFQVHHLVHAAGGYHIENAARLDQVPPVGAWLIAAPVKIRGGSGGPARCWAVFR